MNLRNCNVVTIKPALGNNFWWKNISRDYGIENKKEKKKGDCNKKVSEVET